MASKKEIKEQNPEYVIDLIEIFSENDPSKTKKYLPFMVKATSDWVKNYIQKELRENAFSELFTLINDFDDLSERNLLENKDIYSYKTNDEIVESVKLGKEKVTKSQVKKLETEVLFEDDRWFVIQPLTSRSSNMYGKSTKWCVAGDSENFKTHFPKYTKNGVLVYLIDKNVKENETRDNVYSKVAFHCDRTNNEITMWDSKDKKLQGEDTLDLYDIVPQNVMSIIRKTLKEGKTNGEICINKGVKHE